VEGSPIVLLKALQSLFAAPFRSELFTLAFWRDVLARCGRQDLQILVPILGAASLAGGVQGISYGAVALVLLGADIVVVLRAVFDVRAGAGAGFLEQLVDRAASALAGSLLGVAVANQADILHVNWPGALGIAAAAAATSAVHLVLDALGVPSVVTPVDPPVEAPAVPAGDVQPVDTIDYPYDGDATRSY
jgi:hypothetical protein